MRVLAMTSRETSRMAAARKLMVSMLSRSAVLSPHRM